MNEKRIGEIVKKVYQRANANCVSSAKNALAIHVEDEIFRNHKKKISYRTVERAFERHVFNDKTISERSPESIDLFCKYLGFENFIDYVKSHPIIAEPLPKDHRKWKLIIKISLVFGAVFTTVLFFKEELFPYPKTDGKKIEKTNEVINSALDTDCMTWADSLYVVVSCDKSPLSKYGTQVKPLDKRELKNMRRVEVTAAYDFFTVTGKPRIWYYKNDEDLYEYFTAPGLHPINGETLKKITPYIIHRYVPVHTNKKSSFAQ